MRNANSILSFLSNVGLKTPANFVIKHSFFRHFCGGENLQEVQPTISRLKSQGVGAILDLALEADIDAPPLSGTDALIHTAGVVSAMKKSIDIASHEPDSFIAAKVTSLVPPQILQSWTITLEDLKQNFLMVSGGNDKLDFTKFSSLLAINSLSDNIINNLFQDADANKDGLVSMTDVLAIFSLTKIENCRMLIDNSDPLQFGRATRVDLDTAQLVMTQVYDLCNYAKEKKVKIMIDAEQTYFQPAIDDVALGLAQKFNISIDRKSTADELKGPMIYNTYQMYLKNSYNRLISDVERAQHKGYTFGVKIVRGAYMVSERERAQQLNYSSPIHDSIENTHESYNSAIRFLINVMTTYPRSDFNIRPISFVVASHNKQSVELTCQLSKNYINNAVEVNGIPRGGGYVGFGQLMGMQDSTTYSLANRGFNSLKVNNRLLNN